MKRFFTKTGIWLLAAAATIAVVLCVVSALSSGTGLLHNALGVIASPFRAAGSAVAGWVGGISQRFEDVETLQQENDELRQQIAELEEQKNAIKVEHSEVSAAEPGMKICPVCGREFSYRHQYGLERKYCSRACANKGRWKEGDANGRTAEHRT